MKGCSAELRRDLPQEAIVLSLQEPFGGVVQAGGGAGRESVPLWRGGGAGGEPASPRLRRRTTAAKKPFPFMKGLLSNEGFQLSIIKVLGRKGMNNL